MVNLQRTDHIISNTNDKHFNTTNISNNIQIHQLQGLQFFQVKRSSRGRGHIKINRKYRSGYKFHLMDGTYVDNY